MQYAFLNNAKTVLMRPQGRYYWVTGIVWKNYQLLVGRHHRNRSVSLPPSGLQFTTARNDSWSFLSILPLSWLSVNLRSCPAIKFVSFLYLFCLLFFPIVICWVNLLFKWYNQRNKVSTVLNFFINKLSV